MFSMFGKKELSVPVGEAKPGETAPRRHIDAKDAPWDYPENNKDINTIYALVQWAAKEYGANNAMGWRTVLDVHEETKQVTKLIEGKQEKVAKKWQYFELSSYKYISFNQLAGVVSDYGAGLIHLGVKPNGEERFHIYAQTSAQWLQTAFALNSHGIPIVTAYDTLGESGLTHSLLETNTVGIFTDNAIIHTLVNPLQKAKNIRIIIHKDPITDPQHDKEVQAVLKVRPDIKFYSLNDVVSLGKEHPCAAHPPKPEDVALIMYTSGSAGNPKGVILLNETVIAGVAGVTGNITRKIITSKDRLLAFLPLAHILELTFELCTIFWGGILGYGAVKTLTDESVRNCLGDIREFQPTIMVAVPAVWENVRKGVLRKVKELPPLVQKIFWAAYNTKLKLSSYGLPTPFVDNLVFKKIRAATGGQLRYAFNGGAPLATDTQAFVSNLICPLIIGYGLTETNANTSVMAPANFSIGTQGEPTHAVTIKLVDSNGYEAKNNQGELLIKGKPVMPRYFENEELTKEAFTEDGYFRTGDIAEWTPNGQIKIIDRKKNLVKTLNGEYVAIERLESIYRTNHYVGNICVYADETKIKPTAIVVPLEKSVHQLCQEMSIDIHEDVAHNPKIKQTIERSLMQTAKEQGLTGTDVLQGVVISKIEWSPQNGYLTSAQKLQRHKIIEDNKDDIAKLY